MLNVVPITPAATDEIGFEDFWLMYPRREAKKDALKAWSKLTEAQQMAACIALVGWRKVFMGRDSAQYIPLAASWIRGERWEDELPSEFRQVTSSAHQPLKSAERGERTPMPEALRALLASMKK